MFIGFHHVIILESKILYKNCTPERPKGSIATFFSRNGESSRSSSVAALGGKSGQQVLSPVSHLLVPLSVYII